MYFGKLVFESDEQEFSLRGVKSKKISSHPGRELLKSVLKVRNAWVKVEWVKEKSWVSSAYRWWSREMEEITLTRGVVYMMKRRGPRTEPWGTPQEEVCKEERLLSHLNCRRNDYWQHTQWCQWSCLQRTWTDKTLPDTVNCGCRARKRHDLAT